MVKVGIYKKCIDYLVKVDNIYSWKITDKSLVYYLYNEDGGKGKRIVKPLDSL